MLAIYHAPIGTILPFIKHAKKLKLIKIRCFLDNRDLDLFALNEERKKLENVPKLLIYFERDDFLLTKWKSNNINLSHIEIKRFSSN